MKILSQSFFALSVLLMMAAADSLAQTAKESDAIIGIYQSPDENGKVEFYKERGQYFGKLIQVNTSQNKVKAGTIIFKDLTFTNGHWEGKIYAPAKGKEFTCNLSLKNNKDLEVKVRSGFLSQTREWKRLNN